jgi:hypothetical protein
MIRAARWRPAEEAPAEVEPVKEEVHMTDAILEPEIKNVI